MIIFDGVCKDFKDENETVRALNNVSFQIGNKEHIAVIGRSGCGKSTLLNIMCALTAPTSGRYLFDGKEVQTKSVNDRNTVELRRNIGFINQSSDLFPNLTVLENIKVACKFRGATIKEKTILELLQAVELRGKAHKFPSQLSGGERQRVNIVRALAFKPKVIFADEPTGALDVHTADIVLTLLLDLNKHKSESTLIMVTHSPEAAEKCEKQFFLRNGHLESVLVGARVKDIATFLES